MKAQLELSYAWIQTTSILCLLNETQRQLTIRPSSLIAQLTCGTGLSVPGTGLTHKEARWFVLNDHEEAPDLCSNADVATLLKLSAGSFVLGCASATLVPLCVFAFCVFS